MTNLELPPVTYPDCPAEWMRALYSYQSPGVHELVMRAKYTYSPKVWKNLSAELLNLFLDIQGEKHYLENKWSVVPVPLPFWRRWRRGFNPSAEISKRLANRSQALKYRNILKKSGGKTQGELQSRPNRVRGVRGRFRLKWNQRVASENIILIDDVITTGATLTECRRVLIDAGAKHVIALAIAH